MKSAGFVGTLAGTVRNRTSLDDVLRRKSFGLAGLADATAGPMKPEELRLRLVRSGGEVLSVVERCGLGRLNLLRLWAVAPLSRLKAELRMVVKLRPMPCLDAGLVLEGRSLRACRCGWREAQKSSS
jgi:hypothetical protein